MKQLSKSTRRLIHRVKKQVRQATGDPDVPYSWIRMLFLEEHDKHKGREELLFQLALERYLP